MNPADIEGLNNFKAYRQILRPLHEQKKLLHGNMPDNEPPKFQDKIGTIVLVMVILGLIVYLLLLPGCAYGYTNEQAVKAIIGEAENQGYEGMLAVAGAIHNRGTLKGVCGLHARRVRLHLYSVKTYNMACMAWKQALNGVDITNGATGWGNAKDVEIFKHSEWFHFVYFTAHIGEHYFYNTDG